MRRTRPALIRTQGAGSNYTNLPLHECEPAGHGIGRSRGGLTTKIHTAVDGSGRPLAVVVTGGQRNDGAMLAAVLDEIVVPRHRGRARSHPDAVIADRAYSSGVTRRLLRSRKITAVIPQKRDEIAARKRRGPAGGRPPALDEIRYKQRNLVERSFALLKQWRGLATRYDKLAIVYRAAVVLNAAIAWLHHLSDTP